MVEYYYLEAFLICPAKLPQPMQQLHLGLFGWVWSSPPSGFCLGQISELKGD